MFPASHLIAGNYFDKFAFFSQELYYLGTGVRFLASYIC